MVSFRIKPFLVYFLIFILITLLNDIVYEQKLEGKKTYEKVMKFEFSEMTTKNYMNKLEFLPFCSIIIVDNKKCREEKSARKTNASWLLI